MQLGESFSQQHLLFIKKYPDNVDATTSASIMIDENEWYGTTEYMANLIPKSVNGDIHRIETVTPYITDFDKILDVNHEEMEQNLMPEVKTTPNLFMCCYCLSVVQIAYIY